MRIVLTGASGYVGLHVVRELLHAGHTVTALARSSGRLARFASTPGLTLVETDLEQHAVVSRALEGHDACVHAALIWGAPGTELEFRDTSVAARLFDSAGSVGVKRCVYISSVAVHRPFTAWMQEEDHLITTDLYGATKAAGELVLRAACAEHKMTGVVLRPGPVVGPPAIPGGSFRRGDRIAAMVAAAAASRPIEVVEGEGRQLSDVAAIAKITRLLVTADDPHPTYICVDRELHTWEWVARAVVAHLRSTSEIRVLPASTDEPSPRFATERLERLLGGPMATRTALLAHIHHLAQDR